MIQGCLEIKRSDCIIQPMTVQWPEQPGTDDVHLTHSNSEALTHYCDTFLKTQNYLLDAN